MAALAILLFAGVAPAQVTDAPWPMVGRDASHSGTTDGPEPPYRIAWSSEVPEAPASGPVATGDAVVVVGATSVAALSADGGEPLWEEDRGAGPAGPPAVAGELVVYSSGTAATAELVARSLEDGEERWTVDTLAEVPGGPAVVGETLYAGTRRGHVYAIDAADGAIVWRAEIGGRVDAAPAATDEVVVVVSEDRGTGVATVVALEAASGDERWRFSPQAISLGSSSVALGEDVAFVGMGDGRIRALDLESGGERWQTVALGGSGAFRARHVPALDDELLIPDLRALQALDAASGEERWTYQLSTVLKSSSPAVVGEWVVFGDESGEAAAVDIASGRLVWRADIGDGSVGSPAVDDERVYLSAQGEGGIVAALEHDPGGELLDVPSPTILFPLNALANFAAAAALVGIAALALFRFLVREPAPAGSGEEEA